MFLKGRTASTTLGLPGPLFSLRRRQNKLRGAATASRMTRVQRRLRRKRSFAASTGTLTTGRSAEGANTATFDFEESDSVFVLSSSISSFVWLSRHQASRSDL